MENILKSKAIFIFFLMLSFILVQCDNFPCQSPEDQNGSEGEETNPYENLPLLSEIQTNRSDRFIVDIQHLIAGFPYKGTRANSPHPGSHVHWDNSSGTWPLGGINQPENYPAIYAPVDGYIDSVIENYSLGSHEKYVIYLAFAVDDQYVYSLGYSIEPLVMEPSPGFYRDFILVDEDQEVKKGDIIAYMYVPQKIVYGSHICFQINSSQIEGGYGGNFMAPALFTETIVNEFHSRWGIYSEDNGAPMPSCMGYMLSAEENPYGGEVDELK